MNLFLKKNVWLVILLAVVISFIVPAPGLIIKPYIGYLLMLIMFLSCLDISIRQIVKSFRQYKKILLVLAIVHLASPLFILLLKPFFSEQIFLGLIISAVVCSGMAVIFLSHIFGGLPARALVITSISNLLSPITVPLLVLLFARTSIKIDALSMGLTIVRLVIIPIVLARLLSGTRLKDVLSKYSSSSSVMLVFFITLGIVSPVKDIILSNLKLSLVIAVIGLILPSINFILGYLLGKNKQERITYGISASYKNFTLATVVALSLFSPMVALPVVVYSITNNLLLIPLQLIFIRKT